MAQQPVELILFRQLATTLAVPVFLVDEHGDLVFLNEPAERLLGFRFDDIDEKPFQVWTDELRLRGEDGAVLRTEQRPLVQALRDRRPVHGPLVITGADGVDHVLEVTAFPLDGGRDRLIGAAAMFWEAARE
jgi:PAS domain S-box-containing protein